MKLYTGTSGFSYKEWKGVFYPDKIPANRMLEYYASRLPAVEINNTFYRMPRPEMLSGWAAQVPRAFRFAVKAPRRISHSRQLIDCGRDVDLLLRALDGLGDRLGAILVQLPPHARADAGKLDAFLKLVPGGYPLAFEFRHPSWHDPAVLEVLGKHGAAWVTTDNQGDDPPALPETAAWTYLRLRAPGYTDERLHAWRDRCRRFNSALVFFKHEDRGAGPALAERLLKL